MAGGKEENTCLEKNKTMKGTIYEQWYKGNNSDLMSGYDGNL